jgi:hypothetical protein
MEETLIRNTLHFIRFCREFLKSFGGRPITPKTAENQSHLLIKAPWIVLAISAAPAAVGWMLSGKSSGRPPNAV